MNEKYNKANIKESSDSDSESPKAQKVVIATAKPDKQPEIVTTIVKE